MADKTLSIKLTEDQQNQIKAATGKTVTVLNIDISDLGRLSESNLDDVAGGALGTRVIR